MTFRRKESGEYCLVPLKMGTRSICSFNILNRFLFHEKLFLVHAETAFCIYHIALMESFERDFQGIILAVFYSARITITINSL
jgi:hypothetical protein